MTPLPSMRTLVSVQRICSPPSSRSQTAQTTIAITGAPDGGRRSCAPPVNVRNCRSNRMAVMNETVSPPPIPAVYRNTSCRPESYNCWDSGQQCFHGLQHRPRGDRLSYPARAVLWRIYSARMGLLRCLIGETSGDDRFRTVGSQFTEGPLTGSMAGGGSYSIGFRLTQEMMTPYILSN